MLAVAFVCVITACCCYSPLAAQALQNDPSRPGATGAFIQIRRLAENSASWWRAELALMKRIGMDTLVVNYVARDNVYFYPTSVSGGVPGAVDSIENILDAADEHRMKVFLGLHMDHDQYRSSSFDLQANLSQGQAELNELWTRYGSHASLAGWYMPQEINDYMVTHQPELRDDIVAYTKDLATQARLLTGLPMMISPFFGQNPDAAAYARWWDETGLPETGVDIVALQDGVGTHRTTIDEAKAVFQALQPVLVKHGVAFWANNESFNQIHGWPVDDRRWAAEPTGIDTFVAQIESAAPFVEKSITFEFSTYMSPQRTLAAEKLYQDYLAHIESRTAASQQPKGN
ncbi:MAG: DUF4434 domain-containing protein [Pirellulales bacterium]